MKLFKFLALAVLALIVLVFALPTFAAVATGDGAPHPVIYPELYAQDVTDEPPVDATETAPPDDTPADTPSLTPDPANMNWVLAIIGVLFVLFAAYVLILRPVILQLGQSVPLMVLDSVIAGQERAFNQGAQWALRTPTKIDDMLLGELRARVRADINEVLRARGMPELPPLDETLGASQ